MGVAVGRLGGVWHFGLRGRGERVRMYGWGRMGKGNMEFEIGRMFLIYKEKNFEEMGRELCMGFY